MACPEHHPTTKLAVLAVTVGVLSSGCPPLKVPLTDVGARFVVADMTWFEEERTLFVFYRVDADQGLSEHSRLEISYRTDDGLQGFVDVHALPSVHRHVAARCGSRSICGSASISVVQPPREMRMRMRYHKDGELTLEADVAAHTVLSGPAHTHRSAVVYGVLTEDNTRVQWRLRHQFPAISNELATALGLRRMVTVEDFSTGTLSPERAAELAANPYGYGLAGNCAEAFAAPLSEVDWQPLSFETRARFHPTPLPPSSSADAHVCARSIVTDARGSFVTTALAQKNPQVDVAFPALQSQLRPTRLLRYLLMTCDDIPSQLHLDMQIQRLFLEDAEVICATGGELFGTTLAQRFQERVDAERDAGHDMTLIIGLQRRDDNTTLARTLENALASIIPAERDKSSPRLTGAFVFDSAPLALRLPTAQQHVLWCPADVGDRLDEVSDASERACAVVPDQPLRLGPLSISSLPILPSRRQYLDFTERFGVQNAGEMTALEVLAPQQTPQTRVFSFEPHGVLTFYDNEFISAAPEDAFSYCAKNDKGLIVFEVTVDGETIALPIEALPSVHAVARASNYPLGLAWDFPFLVHLDYLAVLAGAASAYGFTIPFGRSSPAELDAGGAVWLVDAFELGETLLQCRRFCSHPTFDSAGVYNVLSRFEDTYGTRCYRPRFPVPPDTGFPRDP